MDDIISSFEQPLTLLFLNIVYFTFNILGHTTERLQRAFDKLDVDSSGQLERHEVREIIDVLFSFIHNKLLPLNSPLTVLRII